MEQEAKITAAIAALEAQRALLGDVAVNAAIAALQAQLDSTRNTAGQSLDLSGERKLVTVMFADISGFTALSEKMDPEQVRLLMNGCFDYLVPVIQAHEGTIDKFIGDEIMALFGAPVAHERHAELACAASLEMFRVLEAFNRRHHTELELHIGINSGLVIAGAIGAQGRQDYSIMGDAVNLAARLKDAATRGEIFVGEEVVALAKDFFHFQPMPPMRLKGKQELVRSWKLLRQKERHNLQTEKTVQADLIGREQELEAIIDALEGLKQGKGCRIWITGEAGIGKSRLLEEIKRRFGPKALWAEGAALASGRQNAYQLAAEVLTRLIAPGQRPEPEHLKALLKGHFAGYEQSIGNVHFAALCRTMQIALSDEEDIPLRYLKGNELRERVSAAYSAFLTDKAKENPIVMVWDDLHWADPSTLALIEDLIADSPTAPVACILVLRPQREEKAWDLYEKSTSDPATAGLNISLGQLDRSHCASLARKLLNVAQIAPEVETFLLEKAEGNPFFLEELLRSLLDSEVLYVEGKTVKSAAKLESIGIPRTLQGVIASRIDRLQESDKQVLQIASVLGRIFRDIVLAELLIASTDEIAKARLLRKTALCYQGLSRVMEMVAFLQNAQDILEMMHGERNPVWWTEWMEVLNERMMLHYWTNETALMQAFADKIAPNLGAFASPVQQAKYYGNLAALHIRLQEYLLDDTAVGFAARSVDAAAASGNLTVESSSSFTLGFCKLWKNDMEGAIPCFLRSLELAEKTGDMLAQSRNLTYLTVAYRRLGDVVHTDLFARKSLEIAQKINMPEYQGMANANFAWLAFREKRWSDVEAYAGQAFAHWEKLVVKGSSLVFVWLAVFPLSAAYVQRQDYTVCRQQLALLSAPGRKRLEPALELAISNFIETPVATSAEQQQMVGVILQLAADMHYL